MQLSSGYALQFENGGITVRKGERILYTNGKPMYLFVLDYCCITRFFDAAYTAVTETADSVIASGEIESYVRLHRQLYDIIRNGDKSNIERAVLDHYVFWEKYKG